MDICRQKPRKTNRSQIKNRTKNLNRKKRLKKRRNAEEGGKFTCKQESKPGYHVLFFFDPLFAAVGQNSTGAMPLKRARVHTAGSPMRWPRLTRGSSSLVLIRFSANPSLVCGGDRSSRMAAARQDCNGGPPEGFPFCGTGEWTPDASKCTLQKHTAILSRSKRTQIESSPPGVFNPPNADLGFLT